MGIGSGIFLFVVGAILTFALNFETSVIDLDLVGYILMGAGLVVFLISLVLVMRKRSSVSTVRQSETGGDRVTQRETRSDADPLV
ncbi:MAG: hypothetical protein JWL94_1155 [Microbacteriaceae bacterium]|jgi:hypothetical protein|nr:hypothetical protein [Microbacteriaceae bacterium]HEV7956587.1 DUF6458 family protein [Marisediminicola sp.]